ncbi:hypothetical protein V2I21_03235 [Campylobacter sp. CLAX-22107-21]|uniref:hypothetical protein n=1 Tax=Campylobacter devanensis TaxID=3161138 RepID=UPI002EAC7059|nr:hypothetical protein [Campylobacter sp. CLAX-22107-21]
MRNIVLFGSNTSRKNNGLKDGLAQYANVTNLSLSNSTSLQSLYELNRQKNQEMLLKADLFVVEANLNEILQHNNDYEKLSLKIILRNMQWFYESLCRYNKPVCILILPSFKEDAQKISNMHRYFANFYGYCVIDIHEECERNDYIDFGTKFEKFNIGGGMLKSLAKNIAKNIDFFPKPKQNVIGCKLPDFKIITPRDIGQYGYFKIYNPADSNYNEEIFRLEKNYLSLDGFEGYNIIGLHSWNLNKDGKKEKISSKKCFSIDIGNDTHKIKKCMPNANRFCEIQEEIKIKNNFMIIANKSYIKNTEFYHQAVSVGKKEYPKYFDIISLFLCSKCDENSIITPSRIPNEKVEIEKNFDFSHLIPDLEFYNKSMEFIDEYIQCLYPSIKEYIGTPIPAPKPSVNSQFSAVNIVKNHLSYKLGIELYGHSSYLKLLFIFIKLSISHKIMLKYAKKHPAIKSLPDYKEALKIQNSKEYKFGLAILKGFKEWHRGGVFNLIKKSK